MRQQALNLLANGKKEDATTWELIAKAALEDKEGRVRQEALNLLANGKKEDAATWELITGIAHEDKDQYVRRQALNLLANGKKEDATTWELIAKAALEDKESSVRQHVLGLLATHRFDFRTKIILTRDLDGQYPYIDPSRPITKNWIALCATKLGTTTGEVRSMFEKLTDVLPLKFEI